MAHNVTDQSFKKEVLSAEGYVLVDFWAPWCGPCLQLSPIIEEVAEEMSGKVNVMKMNIDENLEIPSSLGIRSVPSLILFKDGAQVATRVGSSPKAALIAWINSHI